MIAVDAWVLDPRELFVPLFAAGTIAVVEVMESGVV
jgi:hypothetical protein